MVVWLYEGNKFKTTFDIKLKEISNNEYDVVILAVAHDSFKTINPKDLIVKEGIVFDVKGFYKDPDFLYL